MTSVFFAVLIMMSVAAGLGFSIAWIFRGDRFQGILEDYHDKKNQALQLKEDQESLIKHANNLQSETLKLSQKNEKLSKRAQSYKDIVQQLEQDKEFIFKEYEQFRQQVKTKLEKSQKLLSAFDEIKDKNQKLRIKADKWKVRFHEAEEKLLQTEQAYLKVNKDKEHALEKLSTSGVSAKSLLEWENNYKELKLQFLALQKEKEDLETAISGTSSNATDESIKRLSEEIVILKKENKKLKTQITERTSDTSKFLSKDKEAVLNRIRSRSKQLDITRIGKADPRTKDNLKELKGLGNLIDQKFQAIGINTFQQMASLNEYDQKLLNFFLELPQGKIESEKWVDQAKQKLGIKKGKSPLKKASENIEKLNLERVGGSSPSRKDNLQSIIGIGPFIEQKLNAIGIFRLEQLAMLDEKDIEEINSIIELAPGHIKNDDWVGQAKRMK